jgi:hypothetical protein
MARALAIAWVLLAAVAPAGAAGDREMMAAQQELKLALDHLRQAQPEYGGHRGTAMQYIDKALQEIHQGIEYSRGETGHGAHAPKEKRPSGTPAEQPDDD